MTDPETWLAERLDQAPPSLRARMTEAVTDANVDDLGIALQAAGERLLRLAQSGPPNHDTGLTLLAADALVTLACEWDARPGE